jgi:hypothetical protein
LKEMLVGMVQGMAGVPISTSMHRQYIIHRRYQTTMIVQGMPRHVVSQSHNVLNIGVKLLHHHIHAAWAKTGPNQPSVPGRGAGQGQPGGRLWSAHASCSSIWVRSMLETHRKCRSGSPCQVLRTPPAYRGVTPLAHKGVTPPPYRGYLP